VSSHSKGVYGNRRKFLSAAAAACLPIALGARARAGERNDARILAAVNDPADLALLQQIVRMRSYSGGGEEGKLGQFLLEEMKALGLQTRLMEVEPGRYNAIGILKGTGGGRSLMFNGHIDTNPVGLGWTVDPLAAEIRDGLLYGIGVSNMKASCAAYFGAMRALLRARRPLKGDLIIAYVVGELQDGIGTLRLLDEGIRADTFIVGEPTDMAVLTLHAASLVVEIDTFGVTRHMSKMEESVSAIDLMMEVIARIESMTFSGPDDPEYASVRRVNIGSMKAGLGPEYYDWRPGQVPDMATIKMSIRFGPGQSRDTVLADLNRELEVLRRRDPRLRTAIRTIEPQGRPPRQAFHVSKNEPIVKSLVSNHIKVRGFAPEVGAIAPMRYYDSDAGLLQHIGKMTGVVCGVGGKFNTMPDERIEVAMYHDAVRIYALTAMDICG
jgi:acetylornithine deacetylase